VNSLIHKLPTPKKAPTIDHAHHKPKKQKRCCCFFKSWN